MCMWQGLKVVLVWLPLSTRRTQLTSSSLITVFDFDFRRMRDRLFSGCSTSWIWQVGACQLYVSSISIMLFFLPLRLKKKFSTDSVTVHLLRSCINNVTFSLAFRLAAAQLKKKREKRFSVKVWIFRYLVVWYLFSWRRSLVVGRQSVAGELFLTCVWSVVDRFPYHSRRFTGQRVMSHMTLRVSQLSLLSLWGWYMSNPCNPCNYMGYRGGDTADSGWIWLCGRRSESVSRHGLWLRLNTGLICDAQHCCSLWLVALYKY